MVRDVGVPAARAEVPDEQAHRVARLLDAPVGPAAAVLRRQQVAVGPRRIGVGHHHVGGDLLAGRQAHAAGALALHHDLGHRLIAAHAAALPLDQAHQALHQAARAAHREVHAEAPLEEGDQAVDRGGGEGIAAHQQRLEGQHHAQPLVLHMLAGQRIDRAIALQFQQLGQHARHVGPAVEGHVAQLLEADLVDRLAGGEEALVAGHVARREAGDLGAHRRGIAAVVEARAIVEADAIERRNRSQVDVVGEASAAQAPQLLEQEGRGDHRRPGIEGEAILAVHIGPAARRIELLEHADPVTPRPQPHRRGQPAEAAADDDGMRPSPGPAPCRRRESAGQRKCQHKPIV